MRRVVVRYHEEPAGWWADSDDVPGWTAVGETFEECRREAYGGLEWHLGEPVDVHEEGVPEPASVEYTSAIDLLIYQTAAALEKTIAGATRYGSNFSATPHMSGVYREKQTA